MTGRPFVDTNILIYAATGSLDDPRQAWSERLVAETPICLSAQVLQEFFVNVTWKPRRPLSRAQAVEWVHHLSTFPCAQVDGPLVHRAIGLSERYLISYWDAAILAAAERLRASVVYTEDLNHGQTYGSVRVENPFLAA